MKKIFLSVIVLFFLIVFVSAQSPYWSLLGNSNATSTSKLGTTNGINLRFYTNNSERARITTSGLFGIGTTSPTDKLHVNSASGTNAFRAQVNGSTKFIVASNGSIGIGTSSPSSSYKLHVLGSSTSGTGIYARGYSYGIQAITNYTYGTGVYGYSDQGYGVYGSSNYNGVYGYGGSYGTYGSSGYTGAYGYGTSYGTYGYSSSGTGATGNSYDGTGVYGYSSSGYGGNFESNDSWGLTASTTYGTYAGVFYGYVYSSQNFITSDKNLKTNIHEMGDAMSIINRLKPQNYEFKKDAKYTFLHLPKGNHYGLLAQDVEQVLPNLVSEAPHEVRNIKPLAIKPTADGKPSPIAAETKETKETINIKAVNYVELIPIIVKALQEQQAIIEKQTAKIESLTQQVNQLSQNNHLEAVVKLSGASLGNATPNPAKNTTRITYNIPATFSRAELVITDAAGQQVKQMQLTKSGLLDIDISRLSAGTYSYSLILNGSSIETRKMIVTR